MKALGFFVLAIAGAVAFAVAMQRFIEWRERVRYEREVVDPSMQRMLRALEEIHPMNYHPIEALIIVGSLVAFWVLALCLADWIGRYLLGEREEDE